MRIGVRSPIGQCDGFDVLTTAGHIGQVEEIWLDRDGEPTALAVRLPDGPRGLLVGDQVDDVRVEERVLTVLPGTRLLELEPPHLEGDDGGGLTASWTTTGDSLPLPGVQTVPAVRAAAERPFWRTIAVLYAVLTLIVLGVIGLDVLLAFLIAGTTHF